MEPLKQRFVARAVPRLGYQAIWLLGVLGLVAMLVVGQAIEALLLPVVARILSPVLYVAGVGGFIVVFSRSAIGRKVTLDVEGDRLIVDEGRGGVFPLADAALGRLRTPNLDDATLLHLKSGTRRLRIAGFGRPRPGVRVAAPAEDSYDVCFDIAALESFRALLDLVPIPVDHEPPPEVLRCELFGHWRYLNPELGAAPDGEVHLGPRDLSLHEAGGRLVSTAPRAALTVVRGMHTLPRPWLRGPRYNPAVITHAVLQFWVRGRCALALGVGDTRIGWRDPTPDLEAPRYMVSTPDWEGIVARLGLGAWLRAPPPD